MSITLIVTDIKINNTTVYPWIFLLTSKSKITYFTSKLATPIIYFFLK